MRGRGRVVRNAARVRAVPVTDRRRPLEILPATDGGDDAVQHCRACGRTVLIDDGIETVLYPGRQPCSVCLAGEDAEDGPGGRSTGIEA